MNELNVSLINELIVEIKDLKTTVIKLEAEINRNNVIITSTNDTLTNHIGFINGIFNSIKKPLFYIMNKVNLFVIEDDNEVRQVLNDG